jgi:hypothetical protein
MQVAATDGGCEVEKWAGAVIEIVDQIARTANVSTESADGFGKRADLNVNAAVEVEVIDRSAAVAS